MKVHYAISNIMSQQIVSVGVGDTLGDAMQQMVDNEIGSVVVTREDEIAGILTERDVLKCFCSDPQAAVKQADSNCNQPYDPHRVLVGEKIELDAKRVQQQAPFVDGHLAETCCRPYEQRH